MKKLTANAIREQWLAFFAAKGHLVLPSRSLVPHNDPSLLWINSGVATLKDYFTGAQKPPAPRLVNAQRSLRTTDIENVGVTSRHHTLFEMLGNFAIGDYFKKEALAFAYELLFKVWQLPPAAVYITYFAEDTETRDLWLALGIAPDHLIVGSRATNFWDVGAGPCGPDTEIFFDRGPRYDPDNVGLKLLREDIENDRYIEVWNIVFSQFNNDGAGHYTELRQKNIDTGAGLERLAAIFQDVPTNYDTDLFLPIIRATEAFTSRRYEVANYFTREPAQARLNHYFRIIADHVRAASVAIADGALPASTGRGYIIRRLIRRAYRAGMMLGITDTTFLAALVPAVQQALPVVTLSPSTVGAVLNAEAALFAKTIAQGEALLTTTLDGLTGRALDFATAYHLYETYGFPLELTAEIAKERGITLDMGEREAYEAAHAAQSRADVGPAFARQLQLVQDVTHRVSEFVGYDKLEATAVVLRSGSEAGQHYALLNVTPFYATSGGQAHDVGRIGAAHVVDVFKDKHGNHWHVTDTLLAVNASVTARVDALVRQAITRNHSATHLLGAALRERFGAAAAQVGSDNNAERLRYDFPLVSKPQAHEIAAVETQVNAWIKARLARQYFEMTPAEAQAFGAVALAGETYGPRVRVVDFGGRSRELCGGTHVVHTGEIEAFKVVRFESKGAGVYRIEAITSRAKILAAEAAERAELTSQLARVVAKNKELDATYTRRAPNDLAALRASLEAAKEDNKQLNKQVAQAAATPAISLTATTWAGQATLYTLSYPDAAHARSFALQMRSAHPDKLIIVGAPTDGRVTLITASQTYDAAAALQALIAKAEDGRGGGNARFAMGSCVGLYEL